jgi:hypothetical protein
MDQQPTRTSSLPHHHGKEPAHEKEQGHAETMNEDERNPVELRLIDVLGGPNGPSDERNQPMQKNPQKHGKGTQGIQVVVSFGRHFILKSQPKTLLSYVMTRHRKRWR